MEKTEMMINARKLFNGVTDLPAIPVIVSKVIALLDKQDSDPNTIADLILSDQVLAARVIRIVNSPLYRTKGEIVSVKRALLFIGFNKIREMILTSYFVEGFNKQAQSFDMRSFWTHSFSVGAISRHIAQQIRYSDIEKAYLVGILHDIGKVFLVHYRKEEYGKMLNGIKNTSFTTVEAEASYFGTTHCEIGHCLAQCWNFPPSYSDVISHHHHVEKATEDVLLTAIVALADFYCLSHYTADSIAQASVPAESEEHSWNILKHFASDKLSSSLEHFLTDLDEEYEAISIVVDSLFSTFTEK